MSSPMQVGLIKFCCIRLWKVWI